MKKLSFPLLFLKSHCLWKKWKSFLCVSIKLWEHTRKSLGELEKTINGNTHLWCMSLQHFSFKSTGKLFSFSSPHLVLMKPIPMQFSFVLTMIRQTRLSIHIFYIILTVVTPLLQKRKWTPFYRDVLFYFQAPRKHATLVVHVTFFFICVQYTI